MYDHVVIRTVALQVCVHVERLCLNSGSRNSNSTTPLVSCRMHSAVVSQARLSQGSTRD